MAPTDSVHVLVVDDDRNVQRMLADALSRAGFQVTVERDGEAALAAFERQSFDVVLLDVLLPALNGYEVARRIKSTPRGERTPVLMLSGIYKTKMHQAQALERHGAAAFVEKPFKLNQLFGKLEGVLGDRFPKPPPVPPPNGSPEPSSEPLADPRAQAEASLVEVTAAESTAEETVADAPEEIPSVPSGAPAPDRGTFATRAFPQILADLHRRRATGGLLLRRDKVKKIVFFRAGGPESVKSNRLSECLGRVMVRERMISEADCEESLKRMKASGRQQGTVLIEMGCISPHNLRYALELQLRLKLLEVFGWTRGEFQFNPKAQPPAETVHLQMSTAAIVYEGIKRSYDTARLQGALGEIAGRYVHPAEDPLFAAQDMSLGEEESGLLALMDGSRTVRELRRRGPLSPLDTDRFLYALLASQMVELRAERRTGPPLPPRVTAAPAPIDRPWDDDEEVLELEDEVPATDDEGHLRERLLGTLAAMRRMDYFELLSLPPEAPPEAVRSAAVELLREYKVDVPAESAEVQRLVQQIAELVGQAHDTLIDPDARARYQAELRAGGVKHEVGDAVGRMLEAERAFRKGEQLLAGGEVAGAHAAFSEAVRLQPDEGEFLALLGWSTHARAPGDVDRGLEALRLLAEAVQKSPALDRAHLYKGHVHKALGQTSQAQGEYEKAVKCNPACTEALRELSILTWAARLSQPKGS